MSRRRKWAGDTMAPPRWATERTDRDTYGPKVAEVAGALGFELMPHQRLILDVALEHEGGRLVYRDVGVSVPRQSSKTTTAMLMLTWRLLAARCTAAYAAQTRLAAAQKVIDDWYPVVARSRLAKHFSVARATGRESLRSVGNGSVCRVVSSDETAGHGMTLSCAVIDEAFAVGPETEQALRPAMSTMSNGQLWACSTAGTAKSTWWRSQVDLGRAAVEAGETSGRAYFEWSMDPDDDLEDPEVWATFHPALGFTIDAATLSADIKAMSPAEARRAYANLWTDTDTGGWEVLDEDAWRAAQL